MEEGKNAFKLLTGKPTGNRLGGEGRVILRNKYQHEKLG